MRARSKGRNIKTIYTVIISIVLILISLSTPIISAAEQTLNLDHYPHQTGTRQDQTHSEMILSIFDEPKDENNDSSYDYLNLNIKLNISQADRYRIYATMAPELPIDTYLKSNFQDGIHDIVLQFNGPDIYYSGQNGPYDIEISIYDDTGALSAEVVYRTSSYSYEQFNPTPGIQPFSNDEIAVVNNTIKLTTNTFVAIIYELKPQIVFYYTSDNGQVAKFKVDYKRVLCFSDQNEQDGQYQKKELQFWGDLTNSHWTSPKEFMENFNNFQFEVQTIVDLIDGSGNKIDTKLELVFHYSSLSKAQNDESARKFDISIKVLGPPLIGVSHIGLEHELQAEIGAYNFVPSNGLFYDKISFMTIDNKEHAYYGWQKSIQRTEKNGKSDKAVTYNMVYNNDESLVNLYLNYPYSTDTIEIFHDPEVGVNPDVKLELPAKPEPDIITHNRWFFIYLVVAVIAASVMIGNIYYQRRKREND